MGKNVDKLLANLERSPALSEDLQRASHRLKKEYKLRKIGFILSLGLLPIFALYAYVSSVDGVMYPSSGDLITGGISKGIDGKTDLLSIYDTNQGGYRDVLAYLGITRDDIRESKQDVWNSSPNIYLWNRSAILDKTYGEYAVNIGQNFDQIYARPSEKITLNNSVIKGWSGVSSKTGWFGISESTGNVYTYLKPPAISPLNNPITYSIDAKVTSPLNNTSDRLRSGNLVQYTLHASNSSPDPANLTFRINIEDVLEYASVTEDLGGARLDKTSGTLVWPTVQIEPYSSEIRVFYIKVNGNINSRLQSQYNVFSYNCSIDVAYGNLTKLPISCPYYKYVELEVNKVDRINIVFTVLIVAMYVSLVIILWLRARVQLSRIMLIKHENHQGPI